MVCPDALLVCCCSCCCNPEHTVHMVLHNVCEIFSPLLRSCVLSEARSRDNRMLAKELVDSQTTRQMDRLAGMDDHTTRGQNAELLTVPASGTAANTRVLAYLLNVESVKDVVSYPLQNDIKSERKCSMLCHAMDTKYIRFAHINRSATHHCGTCVHMMVLNIWHGTEHSLLLAHAELPQPEQPSEPHAAQAEPPTSHNTAGAEPGIFQPLPNLHHQTFELMMVHILHHCHQPCMQCAAYIHYW